MDLELLVGGGLVAAFATWELVRRAVLGSRMERSFEVLKAGTGQMASDDLAIRRAPVREAFLIKAVHHHQRPRASDKESPAELIAARAHHVPLHARRAS